MYKIIVAGCGSMSSKWIEIAKTRSDCEIVALVDINAEAAYNKIKKYSLSAKVYSNINDALEKENADIVFDVTIPEVHFEIVTTALRAGCHVFGEKPMSDSLEKAEKCWLVRRKLTENILLCRTEGIYQACLR